MIDRSLTFFRACARPLSGAGKRGAYVGYSSRVECEVTLIAQKQNDMHMTEKHSSIETNHSATRRACSKVC